MTKAMMILHCIAALPAAAYLWCKLLWEAAKRRLGFSSIFDLEENQPSHYKETK